MKKLVVFLFSISVFAQDYGNNAVAVSFKGVRYILYDPEFMSMLSSNTSNWTNLFILAHEVGHHVNGHSLDLVLYAGDIVDAPELEKKRQQELEADEFAGFVLAKLGASLVQTTSSVKRLSNEDDTYSTHPKRDKRVTSIEKGWNSGYSKKDKLINPRLINKIKNFKSYGWEFELVKPNQTLKNPFDKKKNKIELTSSTIANIFEDRRSFWILPDFQQLEKKIAPPRFIIKQVFDSENNKKVSVAIKNIIDFSMLKTWFETKRSMAEKNGRIALYPSIHRIKIQIIIDNNTYFFDCYNNNLWWQISFYDGSMDDVNDVELFINKKNNVPVPNGNYVYYEDFIQDLKRGTIAYFKIVEVSCHEYNSPEKDLFNTYFINLKGSSKALTF